MCFKCETNGTGLCLDSGMVISMPRNRDGSMALNLCRRNNAGIHEDHLLPGQTTLRQAPNADTPRRTEGIPQSTKPTPCLQEVINSSGFHQVT